MKLTKTERAVIRVALKRSLISGDIKVGKDYLSNWYENLSIINNDYKYLEDLFLKVHSIFSEDELYKSLFNGGSYESLYN